MLFGKTVNKTQNIRKKSDTIVIGAGTNDTKTGTDGTKTGINDTKVGANGTKNSTKGWNQIEELW